MKTFSQCLLNYRAVYPTTTPTPPLACPPSSSDMMCPPPSPNPPKPAPYSHLTSSNDNASFPGAQVTFLGVPLEPYLTPTTHPFFNQIFCSNTHTAQGSLLLLQPLFCGLNWPGSWGFQGSSSSAASTSSTFCIGRGTGETQPQPGPV